MGLSRDACGCLYWSLSEGFLWGRGKFKLSGDRISALAKDSVLKSLIYVAAIIVTAGATEGAEMSVEVLHSDGTPWCSLPGLPEEIAYHTQTGLLACGGMYMYSFCFKFSGGKWKRSHMLKKGRDYHSSWASPLGIVLMGGGMGEEEESRAQTTELLDDTTGDSVMTFPLKYDTE